MKLICPGCGSVASAETWLNDALCRETMLAVVKLPHPLPKSALGYISLFRPGKQALTWKKALRLVNELSVLVATGHVQVQGKVSRPCPPRIWAMAMEQMVEQRNGLSLPMPSHVYLRKVAWDLADKEDTVQERHLLEQEARGHSSKREQQRPRGIDPLQAARDKWDAEHGGAPVMPDFKIKGMD